jgi:hypothetical protein
MSNVPSQPDRSTRVPARSSPREPSAAPFNPVLSPDVVAQLQTGDAGPRRARHGARRGRRW